MTQSYRFVLKSEQDGLGFHYGVFEIGDERYRIDIKPPKTEPRPFFVRSEAIADADPTLWIVRLDGDEIARVKSRDEVGPLLIDYVAGLDRASSASRQHFIDTGRYLRKNDRT